MNLNKFDMYPESQEIRMLDRFNDTMSMTSSELRRIEEEEELEKQEKNVIYDHLSEDEHNFTQFVGFTIKEFKKLFNLVEHSLSEPKKEESRNIRYYPKLEGLKVILKVEPSTLDNMIIKNLDIISPIFENHFITKIAEQCEIIANDDFTSCGYIVDATVQCINKPSLGWDVAAKYFSGKHHYYYLKSQVIVTLKGLAVHVMTGIEGLMHDKLIFDKSIDDFCDKVLSYHLDDPNQIIGDKGYQDIESDKLVTPIKGQYYCLNRDERRFNEKLSKVRIIIENFFGRLKCRYKIIGEKYRGSQCCLNRFLQNM